MSELTRMERELLSEHFQTEKELSEAEDRVKNGEPLAYVIGEWYFYGQTFKLNKSCLIPRPDTEHVVEEAIKSIKTDGKFADLCTGSGCIAISVLKNRPDLTCGAYDISEEALEMARLNADLNGVTAEFICSDVFKTELEIGSYDAIVSNPPYIKTEVLPTLDTVKHEPYIALDGGKDGLNFYRRIISAFSPSLTKEGMFIFEIGYDEAEDIKALASENGFKCKITKDYGGNDRVATLVRKGDACEKEINGKNMNFKIKA